jgi:hypothetical protein
MKHYANRFHVDTTVVIRHTRFPRPCTNGSKCGKSEGKDAAHAIRVMVVEYGVMGLDPKNR